jgi:PAS domain S-box-containing protein
VSTEPFDDYRAVFDAAPDGIVVVNDRGILIEVNPRALAMLGYTHDELLGAPVESIVPRHVRARHVGLRDGFMARPAHRPMGAEMELRAARKDGRELPVEVALRPCRTPNGDFVIAVMRDTSTERRLRTLGAGVLRATEEERQRIARELHDDTAQSLAALLLRLQVLARTPDESTRQGILERMQTEVEGMVEGVRRIARGLRPPALEDVGLDAAIRAQARRCFHETGVDIDLHLESIGHLLSAEGQLVVYRVVQEAISNVVRHAGARHVQVRLEHQVEGDQARVVATIRDDGQGFDAEGVFLSGAGLGLVGMEERARIAGGSLSLVSTPGEGCEVRLRVPVATRTSDAAGAAPGSPGERRSAHG